MQWKPHVEDGEVTRLKKSGSLMILKLLYQLWRAHFQTLLPKTEWSLKSLLFWAFCHFQRNFTDNLPPSCSFCIPLDFSEPLCTQPLLLVSLPVAPLCCSQLSPPDLLKSHIHPFSVWSTLNSDWYLLQDPFVAALSGPAPSRFPANQSLASPMSKPYQLGSKHFFVTQFATWSHVLPD